MPEEINGGGGNAAQRRQRRRRGTPGGPPAEYVYDRAARVYRAPWDVPVLYNPFGDGPMFGALPPQPPGPRSRYCSRHASFIGYCDPCNAYKGKLEYWRAMARIGVDRCYHSTCGHCSGAYELDNEETPASNEHRCWASRDPATNNCRSCGYGIQDCECIWCMGCRTVHQTRNFCSNCGQHRGCSIESYNCLCRLCNECGSYRTRVQFCTNDSCRNCAGCCRCPRCVRCRALATVRPLGTNPDCTHVCDLCNPCQRCAVGFMPYIPAPEEPKFHRILIGPQSAKMFDRVPVKRFMGAEVEAFAPRWQQVGKVVKKWGGAIVSDGSIQSAGNGHGFEVNTAPAMGSLFADQLKELGEAFNINKVQANTSCGVHVHVDASSYGWWDMRKLIRLYAKVEDEVFALCAPYRSWGGYSKKCGQNFVEQFIDGVKEPKGFKDRIMSGLYNIDKETLEEQKALAKRTVEAVYSRKYNQTRYNALNIHSWFMRGTVEFRHYHGSTDTEHITSWAAVCGTLITLAEKLSDADIEAVEPTGTWLRQQVPSHIAEWMTKRTEYQKQMQTRSADEQVKYDHVCGYEYHSKACEEYHSR